ncbi:hypothetical protein ABPG74_003631 [Tetrahymena malaccensis]
MKSHINCIQGQPQQKDIQLSEKQKKEKQTKKQGRKTSQRQANQQSVLKKSKKICRTKKSENPKLQKVRDQQVDIDIQALLNFYQSELWIQLILQLKQYLKKSNTNLAQTNTLKMKIKEFVNQFKNECQEFNCEIENNLNKFLKQLDIFCQNLSLQKPKEVYKICQAIVLFYLKNTLKEQNSKKLISNYKKELGDETIVKTVGEVFNNYT